MYLSIDDRQKIQTALEKWLDEETNIENKKIPLVLLSLIYELNQSEQLATARTKKTSAPLKKGGEEWQKIEQVLESFSCLELPDNIDEEYLEQLAVLAKNLSRLSSEVNRLQMLLRRRHATTTPLKETGVMQ